MKKRKLFSVVCCFVIIMQLFSGTISYANQTGVSTGAALEVDAVQTGTTLPADSTVPPLTNEYSDENLAVTSGAIGVICKVDRGNLKNVITNSNKQDSIDSWDGNIKSEDYWGIQYNTNYGFNKLVYTTGRKFGDGGWFEDSLKVQVRQNGQWVDVPSYVSPEPPYDTAFTSYTFTFADTWGDAIRVCGKPKQVVRDFSFTSISELEVYYIKDQNLPEIVPESVKLSDEKLSMNVGDTKLIYAKAYDKDNRLISGINFEWSSSNPDVATVENGLVTTKKTGKAVITAVNAKYGFTFNINVNVCKSLITPESTKGMYLLSRVLNGKLKFQYEGQADPASETKAKITVHDGYNTVVNEEDNVLSKDEEGNINAEIPIPIESPGYYDVSISVTENGEEMYSNTLSFGVVPGPHEGVRQDSYFASNSFADNPDFDSMIGIKVYRTHTAEAGAASKTSIIKPEYWNQNRKPTDPITPDMFDFTYVDQRIEMLRQYDMSVLGIVGYTGPEWTRTEEARRLSQYGPPRDFNEFIAATVPIIKHYYDQGMIKYIEFWNEPWIYGWTWADTGERFRELQNKWWAVASAQMPDLKMVAGHSFSFSQDHLFVNKNTVNNIFADSSHPYAEWQDNPNSREGRSLRSDDFQVRNAEANGVHTHFITEDGIYGSQDSIQVQKDNANKIITHTVMSALTGVYQGNLQDNLATSPSELPGSVVFGVMTNFLEDRVPVADIWPKNELISGAIYANKKFASLDMPRAEEFNARWNVEVPEKYANDTGKVAVIWNLTGKDKKNLTAGTIAIEKKSGDLKAYNMYGAPIGTEESGKLILPFSKDPIYIVSDKLSVKELNSIIQNGEIKEVQPVNMYFDLITSPLDSKDAKLAVTLQNQLNTRIKGSLQVALPEGWKLAANPVQFDIAPAEFVKLQLPIKKAVKNTINMYPVEATANVGGYVSVKYKQTVQVAFAPEKTVEFTGNISDFDGITPTTLDSRALNTGIDWTYYLLHPDQTPPEGIPDKYIVTRSYTAYDDNYLYLGYAVNEPELASSSDGNLDGRALPYGGDAFNISIGFGERNKNSLRADDDLWAWKGAYRDMDYNYDLFKDTNGNDRLYRLRKPDSPRTVPYQMEKSAEVYPYVGEVSGAKVKITRDEARKITLYQVALPLSEIGLDDGIKRPFRLGFLQTNNEGLGTLEYSMAMGNFDYRCGTDSFSPSWTTYHSLSTWIGFEEYRRQSNPKDASPAPVQTGVKIDVKRVRN